MGAIARAALAEYESGEGRGERVDVDVDLQQNEHRGPLFYGRNNLCYGDSGRGSC